MKSCKVGHSACVKTITAAERMSEVKYYGRFIVFLPVKEIWQEGTDLRSTVSTF